MASSLPKPSPSWRTTVLQAISDDASHPLLIALRTYSLCLSLSLSPVLLPALYAVALRPKSFTARARVLWRALAREVQPTGFASAMTVAVGGGAALQRLWNLLPARPRAHVESKLSLFQKTLLSNVVSSTLALVLLRWKRRRRRGAVSSTLDLSLLFLVRALDASVQAFLLEKGRQIAARQVQTPSRDDTAPERDTRLLGVAKRWQDSVTTHLDALVFWASSARIIWCFFYQPQRLPSTFVKWISSLANVDERLLAVLRARREGTWSYGRSSVRDIAGSLAEDLGRPRSWGDPSVLPAYGGDFANDVWKELGVSGRSGIGGMPCELVHGGIGATFGLQNSCFANAAIRAIYAFIQAFALHLPVHFIPILLAEPGSILRPRRVLSALLSTMQSATALSAFVSSCWFMVCFTRTLVPAWLFPMISHDIWDGPYGGTLAGSLASGMSFFIENERRRRGVGLYVVPKALRASLPEGWLHGRRPLAEFAECLTFVLSLASLLTISVHQPESLRGVSRSVLACVMKGRKAWRDMAEYPPKPLDASTTPPPADTG